MLWKNWGCQDFKCEWFRVNIKSNQEVSTDLNITICLLDAMEVDTRFKK